ncbi:hypothetical protein [Cesiribacter andamanensis]|uniref:Uncharacterized protein n=1 Tax=Cesiribacter andamanensis AMV16 TaxID=1279009 RepID=M7N4D7_9BACT|nr:hypothetical protein [Cesiribacter andamanensis]EMR02086.1 hypothetical protein ADICEAN_02793 [Cesiribacter andamanensis AMV16]
MIQEKISVETRSQSLSALSRIAQNSQQYYTLLEKPMGEDGPGYEEMEQYHAFLQNLPEGLKAHFQRKGYAATRKNVLFRRFLLERSGKCMKAFLQESLDAAEFRLWQEQDSYQQELLQRLNQLG